MPELVNHSVSARNVRKGDVIADNNEDSRRSGWTVTEIRRGTKWVHLFGTSPFGGDVQFLLKQELDAVVNVLRSVPTKEERAEALAQYRAERAHDLLTRWAQAYEDEYEKLKMVVQNEDFPSPNLLSDLYQADALREHAARVRHMRARSEPAVELYELLWELRDQLVEELVMHGLPATWSGAFSFTNAVDQTRWEVKRRIARDVTTYLGRPTDEA